MVATVPISGQDIVRAAKAMIIDYGPEALAKASQHSREPWLEWFESIASLICRAIEDCQDFGSTHNS